MSGYKLYYFNGRGRAEICRLAFAAAKVEYEDNRLDGEQWKKEKASGRSPFGQMPFLVTPEGKTLGQSCAILKYICKKTGLCPEDPYDEGVADEIVDAVTDLLNNMVKIHFEKDEAKKAELQKEFQETTLPTRLGQFQNLFKGPFFLGDKLTYADLMIFNLFNGFLNKGKAEPVPEVLGKFPKLADHYKRVLAVPEIKTWVEKRPETEM